VLSEADFREADDEVGGGSERADGESSGVEAEESSVSDGYGGESGGGGGVGEDGQDTEVERIGIEEEAQRHGERSERERDETQPVLRDVIYDNRGHGGDHAGSLHDAGEGSGGEEDAGHEDGCGRVGCDSVLLRFQAGEVEGERDDGAEHEGDGGINAAADHGAEDEKSDQDIQKEEAGTGGFWFREGWDEG